MTALAPDLFDRRFEDLLEIGRSQLPGLAPGWTDYNLHDPGITLLELLAWVAEAQMYSLSRTRRDERAAYAALSGLAPHGPLAATGLIWPARPGAQAPSLAAVQSMVIAAAAPVGLERSDTLAYRTGRKQLWIAADLRAVRSGDAHGRVTDHTSTNERASVPFLPFGDKAGSRDVLELDIACRSDAGLFPARRADADGACLTIGVRADGGSREPGQPGAACQAVAATLKIGERRYPLDIVEDTTRGFMRTGALSLALPALAASPREFILELRSPRGFARPPRILAIALNVLPIRQGSIIERELHIASTVPDQVVTLEREGLEYDAAVAVAVETIEASAPHNWRQVADLAASGPSDRDYVLDAARAAIRFGNGINGRIPLPGAQLLLSYSVSDGAAGNTPRNQRWMVRGFAGVYGANPDAVSGGVDGSDLAGQRREARRRARAEHALVTAGDLEAAAVALPDLEVARALALAVAAAAPATGAVTLVAMRARPGGIEPAFVPGEPPEPARWLAEVERRLAPRLPLGLRLRVRAPSYIPFHVVAQLDALEDYQPAAIAAAVRQELAARLALTPAAGSAQRAFGLGVSRRDVSAWIRTVPGVARVRALKLFDAAGKDSERIIVPRHGLPKFDMGASIVAVQAGKGAR